MENTNFITALIGAESLLLVLPKDVTSKLSIENHDILEYKVRKGQLIIKKLEDYNVTTLDAIDNSTLQLKPHQRKNISEVFTPNDTINI